MVYKPVLCELKCIRRDVKNESGALKDILNNISFKQANQELNQVSGINWLQLIGVMFFLSVMLSVLDYIIAQISLLQLIFFIIILLGSAGIIIMILIMIARYLNRVHQRCINHSRQT